MPYIPINWNELPSSDFNATPLNAANLNHMDQGIKRTHAEAMTTVQRNALRGADLFTLNASKSISVIRLNRQRR